MSIVVFQHGALCGPGRLGATFRDHGLKLEIRRLDVLGAAGVPSDLDDVQGVITLGGDQNVGEPHPWMQPELEFLRRVHESELPVIGVCLGAQMIACALGGEVGPMSGDQSGGEWGFCPVSLNPHGQTDPIFAGVLWDSMQFQAHGQEVRRAPAGATVLARSPRCAVQAFRVGLRTYAFQYHLECDRAMIEAIARDSAAALAGAGLTVADVLAQADRHYAEFARLADRVCVNLAAYLFPLSRRGRR